MKVPEVESETGSEKFGGQEKGSSGRNVSPVSARPRAPKIQVRNEGRVCAMYGDKDGALDAAFGTTEPAFTRVILEQLVNVLHADPDKPVPEETLNAAIAAVHGMNVTTELEAMLAAQMYAVHLLSMRCAKEAVVVGQGEHAREYNLRQSVKLMGTFTRQVEALQRLRTGAQQRVSVEHVHVHQGGQAIVGQVNPGGTGRSEGATP